MTGQRRLRVGIFAGGRSAEHEVSVASAESVLRAIDRERFEPYLVYIDRQGSWHLPAGPAGELGSASREHREDEASARPASRGPAAKAKRAPPPEERDGAGRGSPRRSGKRAPRRG
jgi:D-alanine-D-alanine ligase-like ATP-grasp enzyme